MTFFVAMFGERKPVPHEGERQAFVGDIPQIDCGE